MHFLIVCFHMSFSPESRDMACYKYCKPICDTFFMWNLRYEVHTIPNNYLMKVRTTFAPKEVAASIEPPYGHLLSSPHCPSGIGIPHCKLASIFIIARMTHSLIPRGRSRIPLPFIIYESTALPQPRRIYARLILFRFIALVPPA